MRSDLLAGPLRRIAACALLAITLAGNFASHHHSLLSSDEGAGRGEERVVTRHNPLSRASHWHAVLAFVHEQECVACHNQRLAGLPVLAHEMAPAISTKRSLPIRSSVAPVAPLLFTASRAPPVLL
jgi:hypothetical protein